MRTIKFRGKRVDNGEWVEGSLVMVCNGETLKRYPCIVISYNHDVFDWHEVIPETVSQFTGLTDKNGKEIYEGDILRIHVQPDEVNHFGATSDFIVETELTSWGFETTWNHVAGSGYQCSTHIFRDNPINYEIIGTIHDKQTES